LTEAFWTVLHACVLALPQQCLGGEGRGAEALLATRLVELGGSGVSGWLEWGQCFSACCQQQ